MSDAFESEVMDDLFYDSAEGPARPSYGDEFEELDELEDEFEGFEDEGFEDEFEEADELEDYGDEMEDVRLHGGRRGRCPRCRGHRRIFSPDKAHRPRRRAHRAACRADSREDRPRRLPRRQCHSAATGAGDRPYRRRRGTRVARR